MAPGARSKFGAPSSNLRFFGSKCAVLKKVLVTLLHLFGALRSSSAPIVIRRPGNCASFVPPFVTPLTATLVILFISLK